MYCYDREVIFFKQKTAYEMRISDWSSDVCSSDLFPADVPREQIVIAAPEQCPCCGSDNLSHLPPTITETLEKVPARHKVIQTVREKVACRHCEKISQPPAPFHVTPRGLFGPHLLASPEFQKYGLRSGEHTTEIQALRSTWKSV